MGWRETEGGTSGSTAWKDDVDGIGGNRERKRERKTSWERRMRRERRRAERGGVDGGDGVLVAVVEEEGGERAESEATGRLLFPFPPLHLLPLSHPSLQPPSPLPSFSSLSFRCLPPSILPRSKFVCKSIIATIGRPAEDSGQPSQDMSRKLCTALDMWILHVVMIMRKN